MLQAALRKKELKRKQAERKAERDEIKRKVADMNTATRGEVLWGRKMEILELLEGYEFKRRNTRSLYDLSSPNVSVKGNEFDLSQKTRDLVKTVQKWYRDNLQGKTEENSILGTIRFTGIGKGELGGIQRAKEKYLLLPYLRELIKTATDVQKNVDPKNDAKLQKILRHGWKVHYLWNSFQLQGENETRRVRITILEDNEGNKFYALGKPQQNTKEASPGIQGAESSNEALADPAQPRNPSGEIIPEKEAQGSLNLHTEISRRSVASVRREMKEYLGENPGAEEAINPEDLAALDKRTLDTMSLDDVRKLHGRVMELREKGRLELEMKKAERAERTETLRQTAAKMEHQRRGQDPPVLGTSRIPDLRGFGENRIRQRRDFRGERAGFRYHAAHTVHISPARMRRQTRFFPYRFFPCRFYLDTG
ncbi:MAG: hypothetical protein LBO82_00490 [Synergistaceae bacterium]|nr:hypothetical protein [Synergistaceae bacterium]